jgi:tetratricopeptide (TPR) repeat protein
MTDAPTTPDPIEIAMEAEATGQAPEGVAHALLVDQRRLVRWQIAGERAGFILKLAAGLAGLALAAGLGCAVWDASQARGTVIEPFDTAPALAAQGLTGGAVANELQARLTALQVSATTDRALREFSSSASQINVVIPQTGVSVGEALQLLRGWLGHETHVSGALRPTPDGALELSLRVDGRQVAVTPPPAELRGSADAWLAAGAEAALRETDPYRYANWLTFNDRDAEVVRLVGPLMASGSRSDRAWGWVVLATNLRRQGDFAGSIRASEMAYRLNPHSDSTANGLVNLNRYFGRDEAMRYWARAALAATDHRDRGRVAQRTAQVRGYDNDWLGVVSGLEALMATADWGAPRYPPNLLHLYAEGLARLHEPTVALLSDPIGELVAITDVTLRAAPVELAEAGRWNELAQLLALPWSDATPDAQRPYLDRTVRWPWQAYLAARGGRFDEARALVGRTPPDCYFCLRVRGQIEALGGQPAQADRWFTEAVRQGPSLANAEQEWAEAKLVRGDRPGALALAREAARKAPHWADPRKLEGDVLALAGDDRAAIRAYEAATRLAPRWGGLHIAWGKALARQGKTAKAQTQWRAASDMDLGPEERAELARVWR